MFIFVVAASLAVAWLRGGRLERLTDFPFRHVWLIFAAFTIQFFLHLPTVGALPLAHKAAPYLYSSAYYLLLVCFALNRRAPGVVWLAAGTLANLTVITANGGKMPVDGEKLVALGCAGVRDYFAAGSSLTHRLITPETRLPWLGDVLVGSPPFPNPTLFSAGDLLLAIGVFVLVQGIMVGRALSTAGETG